MANELLRTLTIDGVPQDIAKAGNFLRTDTDNNILRLNYTTDSSRQLAPKTVQNNTKLTTEVLKGQNVLGNEASGIIRCVAVAAFPSNATGIRSLAIEFNGTAITRINVPAASGGMTILTVPLIGTISYNDTFSVLLWQNSGSSLTVTNLQFWYDILIQ